MDLLAIMNKAAMNIGIHMFVQVPASGYLRYLPKSGIVILCLFVYFWGIIIQFPQHLCHFPCHQQYTRVPFSPHPCQCLFFFIVFVLLIVAILMDGKWYIIVVLIRISIMAKGVEYLFSCTHWPFVHLLWISVFKSFALKSICLVLLLLLLSCRNSLYILDINSLSSTIWLADFFFHSVGCLFMLLIVSFDVQKFLIWMKSNFPIFSFLTCAFVVISKKWLSNTMSWSFPLHILVIIL